MYEDFERILKSRNLSSYKVAKEAGVTQTALSNWKNGKSTPSTTTLQKIADYLGVTIDFLTNGNEPASDWQPALTAKDEKDLDKKVEDLLSAVDSDTGLMLDGQIMDEETREIFAMNLKNALRTTKLAAKAKYTPKKYRK